MLVNPETTGDAEGFNPAPLLKVFMHNKQIIAHNYYLHKMFCSCKSSDVTIWAYSFSTVQLYILTYSYVFSHGWTDLKYITADEKSFSKWLT